MEQTYSDERMEPETVYLIFGQNVKAYRKSRGARRKSLRRRWTAIRNTSPDWKTDMQDPRWISA